MPKKKIARKRAPRAFTALGAAPRRRTRRKAKVQEASFLPILMGIGNLVGAITKAYTDYYGQPTDLPATPAPATELTTTGVQA